MNQHECKITDLAGWKKGITKYIDEEAPTAPDITLEEIRKLLLGDAEKRAASLEKSDAEKKLREEKKKILKEKIHEVLDLHGTKNEISIAVPNGYEDEMKSHIAGTIRTTPHVPLSDDISVELGDWNLVPISPTEAVPEKMYIRLHSDKKKLKHDGSIFTIGNKNDFVSKESSNQAEIEDLDLAIMYVSFVDHVLSNKKSAS